MGLAAVALAGILPALAAAQAPATGVEAASALERALVEVIARTEKSIVAIARVQKDRSGAGISRESRPEPFGGAGAAGRRVIPSSTAPQPTDPDFVPTEFATGVVVDRRGLILTAYHALGDEEDYYVTTCDRKVYKATIKGADPRSDLAVLAISAGGLVPLALGDASTLRKGQIVIALGNPYAIARDGQPSASWGIVANLSRKAPTSPEESTMLGRPGSGKATVHHFGTLIQTDARLNLGTSGGALVNLRGEMVGLTTSLAALAGYEQAAGYAFPVDAAFRRALETLKQGREMEYGFLGIQPANLTLEERGQGLQGIRVNRVVPGGPAQRYGIKSGDLVYSINGRPLHDADELVLEIGKLPVDGVARLQGARFGRTLDVDVTLSKYPVRGKKVVTTPAPSWRGVRVDYLTAVEDEAGPPRRTESSTPRDAVLVVDVEPASPAWSAGIRPGMVIVKVSHHPVRTPKEFHQFTQHQTGAVELLIAGEDGQPSPRIVPSGS